jgi:hypothetical protein
LPSTPGPTAGQTIVPIRFGEGFPIAFKNRIDALQDPSTPGVVSDTTPRAVPQRAGGYDDLRSRYKQRE